MASKSDSRSTKVQQLLEDLVSRVNQLRHLSVAVNCVYLFKVISTDRPHYYWTLNLESGVVYPGTPEGTPDCTYVIDEENLILLLQGTLNSAQAYLSGKLKILGNTQAAFKFQKFMADFRIFSEQNSNTNTMTPSKLEQSILDTIPIDGLKSDVVFEILRSRFHLEPELFRKILFLVQINFTQNRKPIATWTIDTKNGNGRVYRTEPPAPTKPDATLTIEDEDYVRILFGKLNPQKAFMSGKFKVKGNIMLLQKLDSFWNQIQTTRRDPELKFIKEVLLGSPLQAGLRSEIVMFDLIQRMARLPNLLLADTSIQFNITKDDQTKVIWIINFGDSGKLAGIKRVVNEGRPFPKSSIDLEATLDDTDFVYLTRNPTFKLQDAVRQSRVKCEGNTGLVAPLEKLFQQHSLQAKL